MNAPFWLGVLAGTGATLVVGVIIIAKLSRMTYAMVVGLTSLLDVIEDSIGQLNTGNAHAAREILSIALEAGKKSAPYRAFRPESKSKS